MLNFLHFCEKYCQASGAELNNAKETVPIRLAFGYASKNDADSSTVKRRSKERACQL